MANNYRPETEILTVRIHVFIKSCCQLKNVLYLISDMTAKFGSSESQMLNSS